MLHKILFTVFIYSINIGYSQNERTFIVPFTKNNANVLEVAVGLNGFPTQFIFDPGATITSFDKTLFTELRQKSLIDSVDIRYRTKTKTADGRLADAFAVNIKSFRIGGLQVDNLEALVIDVPNAPSLLGQNFLQTFSSFAVDNAKSEIVFKKTIRQIRYIPCSQNLEPEIERVAKLVDADNSLNFDTASFEKKIPTSPITLKRITHRVMIRYFDKLESVTAAALKIKLIREGYKEDEIYTEDMTPYYSKPIPNYVELWIKF